MRWLILALALPGADEAPERVHTLTVYGAFAANANAAAETFTARAYDFWGFCKHIERGKDGTAVVVSPAKEMRIVLFAFDKEQAKKLPPGQPSAYCSIIGSIDRYNPDDRVLYVKDCRWVRIIPDRDWVPAPGSKK
jgi:hypothetical protein